MAKSICFFNHKGGVSKTTTTFNLGWKMASQGKKTILIDADPQCNLTGLVMGYQGPDELLQYYTSRSGPDLKSALYPAFESQPIPLKPVDCIPVEKCSNLFLLPGHIGISEYDATLALAQQTGQTIVALRNVPGSISYLIRKTGENMHADFILIDLNPSLSAFNQNILMTSDYFIMPTAPDFFSLMAVNALARILPEWKRWAETAASLKAFQESAYPFPSPDVKFMGSIVQRFSLRESQPSGYYMKWIGDINKAVRETLFPALKTNNLTLPEDKYGKDYCLSQIPDFTGLITKSQEHQTPVFALTDAQIGMAGVVLEQTRKKRDEFDALFDALAARIEGML